MCPPNQHRDDLTPKEVFWKAKYLIDFGAHFAIYQVFSISQRSYTYENQNKISTEVTQEFINYSFLFVRYKRR